MVFGATESEVGLGVVNDVLRAQRSHHLDIPGAANPCYFCAQKFRNLNGECADSACSSVDENLLTWLKLSNIAKTLQGGQSRDRHAGRLLEGKEMGLGRQGGLTCTGAFGEGAFPRTEDEVTWLERRDAAAHRDDLTGQINAWAAGFKAPVKRIDGSRAHLD